MILKKKNLKLVSDKQMYMFDLVICQFMHEYKQKKKKIYKFQVLKNVDQITFIDLSIYILSEVHFLFGRYF